MGCGAALVSMSETSTESDIVITALHCISNHDVTGKNVTVGDHEFLHSTLGLGGEHGSDGWALKPDEERDF